MKNCLMLDDTLDVLPWAKQSLHISAVPHDEKVRLLRPQPHRPCCTVQGECSGSGATFWCDDDDLYLPSMTAFLLSQQLINQGSESHQK